MLCNDVFFCVCFLLMGFVLAMGFLPSWRKWISNFITSMTIFGKFSSMFVSYSVDITYSLLQTMINHIVWTGIYGDCLSKQEHFRKTDMLICYCLMAC